MANPIFISFALVTVSLCTVLAHLSPSGSVSPLDDFEAVSGYHFTINMLLSLKDKV